MDFFKSAVASAIAKGSSFPYAFGDRVDNDESIWTLHNATKREDGTACSIFAFDINANRSRLPLAKNAARKFRTLRHPGIIKILETIENETNIYIVTERATPLSWHVKRKSLSEETVKWGLFSLANAIKFINDDATSVHGLVRVSSIYTSESGEWKLGGLDILSSMKEDDAVIYNYGGLVPDSARYAPPEVTNQGWTAIKRHPLPATDAYNYGILVYEIFNGSFRGRDQLGSTKSIPPSMHQSYKRLLNSNPKLRLSTGHFLEQGQRNGSFFETPLIRLTQGIESLGLKDETERDEFLSELDSLADDFPEDFFKMKVLPELLKSVEFGGGGPKVFNAILRIGDKLSEDEYESRIVPVIVRLFALPDRVMRVCLLENLPKMIDHLPQKVVSNKIFPSLITGFTDTAPVVREQTVMSVLTVINKLSDRVINGELLKYLAKTANDEQPGIRTNTTICLGKIAKSLGAHTRSKVLVAAFTRSLRDPFVHARNAALMALGATIDCFTEDDCATKILPALCTSLIDSEKLVRDQSNKILETYLQRIRKYSVTLGESNVKTSDNVAPNNASSARIGTQNDSSWAGWAISSFTNKLSSAKGEMQPATNNITVQSHTTLRPSSVPPRQASPANSNASEKAIRSPISRSVVDVRSQTLSPNEQDPEEDEVFDAWGTMDDEDDSFFDAPTTRKLTKPETVVTFDDAGEPDFAGWLAAQSQAKAKKPLPKGLSKPTQAPKNSAKPTTGTQEHTAASASTVAGVKKSSAIASRSNTAKIAKVIDTKPKENDEVDDGWGDAWD